jgi:hypothetical protein
MNNCLSRLIIVSIWIDSCVYGLVRRPVQDIIETTGSLTCHVNDNDQTFTDYHLCVIRVYNARSSSDNKLVLRNGIWYTNVFRRAIALQNCTDFSNTTDIGIGVCQPMPYENVDNMTLCICATSNCNLDLQTCRTSVDGNAARERLPDLIDTLSNRMSCHELSDPVFTCSQPSQYASFVNSGACKMHVVQYGVLCSIIDKDKSIEREILIETNYQLFLTMQLHQYKIQQQTSIDTVSNETDTNIYTAYNLLNTSRVQQCLCTQTSYCNNDVIACAPQIFIRTNTTTRTSTVRIIDTSRTSAIPKNSSTIGKQ